MSFDCYAFKCVCLNKVVRIFEFASLNRSVRVVTPDLRSWWEPCGEESGAVQRVLSQEDSWLSNSPVVCVLTRQSLYPRWQNTASGPEHPLTTIWKSSSQPGSWNSYRHPWSWSDPYLPSLSLHTNTSWIREEAGVSNYHIVPYHQVLFLYCTIGLCSNVCENIFWPYQNEICRKVVKWYSSCCHKLSSQIW